MTFLETITLRDRDWRGDRSRRDDGSWLDLCQTPGDVPPLYIPRRRALGRPSSERGGRRCGGGFRVGHAAILHWAGGDFGAGGAAAYRFQDILVPWIEGKPNGEFILVSGNIEAHESVLSFKTVQSRIVELPFDEGQTVKAGTVIARVDDADYKQQVDNRRGRAQRPDAPARRRRAERRRDAPDRRQRRGGRRAEELEFDRAQTLLTKGAGTIDARDVAETALKQSRAALERDKALEAAADKSVALAIANIGSARAALELAKIVLGYTTLTAPFDGVILVRQAELGEVVSPGAAIVTLADIDHVWLRAYVNETDVGKIRLGEAATVTTDSYPGKEYPGRISFISEAAEFTPKSVETHAERVTLVYRIRIDIDNPSHELVPGLPADAKIPLRAPGQS